jgi:acyl-CoA dehydrogenase
MAGRVRQPIEEKAFEKYLSENVPAVKTPIELKQVGALRAVCGYTGRS